MRIIYEGKGIMMTDNTFDECVVRMQKGDKEALHQIYQEYLGYIYSIVLNLVQNKENAEDITSDFFIKLWVNADKYKPGSGHKGYLATIARNMSIDFLRSRKKEQLVESFEASYDEADREALNASEVKEAVEANEPVSLENQVIGDISLKEALDTLKDSEKEVINLKIMGEMTFNEISTVLNKPMGTVTWIYRQAIEKLRRYGYE